MSISAAPLAAQELEALLAGSTPQERTQHLLRLMEAPGSPTLDLPGPEGGRLSLQGVRFDPPSLEAQAKAAGSPPPWWSGAAALLAGARFGGANLQDAHFSEAELKAADFTGAAMRSAVLRGARIEAASFSDADLIGADFSAVAASEARFGNAMLEDARFTGAVLRYTDFSRALLDNVDFSATDLWGARLEGAEAVNASFRDTRAAEANFAGADLTGADFENADLKKVNFRGARLRGANMRGATLTGADLEGCDLTDAILPRVNLAVCNLRHARIAGAWLESTRMTFEQFGGMVGEQVAGDWEEARQAYLTLERNFRSLGVPEAASQAYRLARRMGRREARRRLAEALHKRRWREAAPHIVHFASDAFAEWLCDYGESLPRVGRAYLAVLLVFAAFYGVTGSLQPVAATAGAAVLPTSGVLDLIGFSFLNMSTSVTPDIGLKPASHFVYFVTSLQYVVGVVLIGLFGYVLGNRIRR